MVFSETVSIPHAGGLLPFQLRGASTCEYFHYCRQAGGRSKGLEKQGMLFYSLAPASFENRSILLCPSRCIQIGKKQDCEDALNSQIGDVCLTAAALRGEDVSWVSDRLLSSV